MGAWDVGIFDNDTSVDVRGFYEDFLLEDEATATARVLEKFAEDLEEPEVAPDVLLGLAGAQWELGRPDPEVIRRALAIVEDGSDVERWRELDAAEEDVQARAAALDAFAAKLRGTPPPPSLPEPPPDTPLFGVGDILKYRLPSGRFVGLCVSAVEDGDPVCTFIPQALPEPTEVDVFMAMDIAEDPHRREEGSFRAWMLRLAGEPDERMQPVSWMKLSPAFHLEGHVERLEWSDLAAYLEAQLGLR